MFGVLGSEFDHRACEVINPTKERGPKTLYKFSNRIIIYMYLCKIINFIKWHQIYFGLLIIFKCFEHQFIPNIESIGIVHLHARVVILKLQRGLRAYSHQRPPIWRTTFFRRRTSRCLQKLVRQWVPFQCMEFWYIRSRISAAEKTRVFGVNRPLGWICAWRHNHAINERTINRRAINDYMERLHPMMKYGNFIEVYNLIIITDMTEPQH